MEKVLKILFVEDLISDAELIWHELEINKVAFERVLVDNKKDFLDGLESFNPDIIISDYSLPRFDGMAALKLRNEKAPHTPFILVTGSMNEEVAVECMKTGADDYVIKDNLSRLVPAVISSLSKNKTIREKMMAVEALRISEKKLREAQSLGQIGSWEFDIETNKIEWSAQTYILYHRDPLLGPPTPEEEAAYYSIEQNLLLQKYGQLAITEGKESEYDFQLILPDGNIACFLGKMQPLYDEHGKVIRLIGTVQDITKRKLAEQQLKEASDNWNKTFDSIQDAVVLLDANQQIVLGNKAFLDITGETGETITSHFCFGYVHHTKCPIDGCPFIRMQKSRKREEMELKINEKLFRIIVDPIIDNNNNITGAVHIMSDITEQRITSDALKERELIFRNLVEKMPDGVYKTTHEGRIVEVNTAMAEILGFSSKEELIGINIPGELYFDPADRERMTIEGMNNELISYRLRKKDGSEVWVEDHGWYTFNDSGEIIFHEGVIRDVTLRRQQEYRIRTLGRAIEQSPVSVVITDSEGNIEFVNDEFVTYTQYALVDVKGRKPRIFNPGHLQHSEYDTMWQTLHNNSSWRGEFYNRKKDGTLYPEEVTISTIRNTDGSISNFILIMEDITEKKKILSDLIVEKHKAEESDRLKTAFLHNISHEIRTPMNAIVGFSALLNEPEIDTETRQSYSEMVVQSSNHLLSIITDIVDIANIEANIVKVTKNLININSLLNSLYAQFISRTRDKNIKFDLESTLSDSDAIIITDSTKITQILSNLITNAIKFTDTGTIKVRYQLKENYLEFCVSDSGIGIPQDDHKRIFDRFYQVQNKMSRLNEGTGLGLAISKAYVDLLGGEIWIDSEIGKGTSFYFTIPNEKPDPANASSKELKSNQESFTKYGKIILIAEDIESNFKLLTYYLAGTGIEILWALNGKEAVEKCQSGRNINLILMDLEMPVMDGYEATKIIKKSNPVMPIIAQTAYADDLAKTKESGFDGFISKPFTKQQLLSLIKDFL